MKYFLMAVSIVFLSFVLYAQKKGKPVYLQGANGFHHLNTMENEWRELNEKDGYYATFTPCRGVPEEIIIKKEKEPKILKRSGTCGAECSITQISKSDKPDEYYAYIFTLDRCHSLCTGHTLNFGKARMYMIPGPDEAPLVKNGCAVWLDGMVGAEKIYVPAENSKNFPNKVEPCI